MLFDAIVLFKIFKRQLKLKKYIYKIFDRTGQVRQILRNLAKVGFEAEKFIIHYFKTEDKYVILARFNVVYNQLDVIPIEVRTTFRF